METIKKLAILTAAVIKRINEKQKEGDKHAKRNSAHGQD